MADFQGRITRTGGSCGWGAHTTMTENERRARDILTRDDVLVRIMAVVALISMFLLLLLVANS